MIQINSFNRSKLRNNELHTFYTEVATAVSTAGTGEEKLNVADLYTAFNLAVNAYGQAILNIAKSALTADLTEADAQRDNLFVGFCETVRNGLRHFTPAKQQAARLLMPVVEAYTGAADKSIDDETGYITNFLTELDQDKYVDAFTALDLNEWFEALGAANDKVAKISAQRTAEQVASGTSTGAGTATRAAADAAYNALTQMLNALCMVKGEALYRDTFEYINARIKHYQDLLAQRKGVAEAGKKE